MTQANTYPKTVRDPTTRPYPLGKEEVARLYYEERLPLPEVAEIAGTSRQRLARWMEYWGLRRRTSTQGRTIFTDRRRASRGPNWHGKQWRNRATGLWYTYAPGHPRSGSKGEVPIHILVAETRIGRYLNKGEVVHHLDKDKENNDLENLCVMLNGEHLTLHRLLGDVGIALLTEGKTSDVLRLVSCDARRRFVEFVYDERLCCVSGLLDVSGNLADDVG